MPSNVSNRNLVSIPAAHVISSDNGAQIAEVLQAPPATGVDWGLAVYADLGSGVVAVSQELQGAANLATGQVALNISTPTSICAAQPTRRSAIISNTSASAIVWIGGAAVTSTTGQIIPSGASLTIPVTTAIYGIASTTETVTFAEAYD